MFRELYKSFNKSLGITKGKKSFSLFCKFLTTVMLNCDIEGEEGSFIEKEYLKFIQDSESGEMLKIYNNAVSILNNFSKDDLVIGLVNFYELEILDEASKKKNGIFYTPLEVAENIVKSKGILKNKSFYDPFCGAGMFLVAIAKNSKNKNIDLYGSDIDEAAISLARFLIFIFGKRSLKELQKLCSNIRVLDTLSVEVENVNKVKSICRRVDTVITNPPYGFAISREMQFSTKIKIPDREVFYFSVDKISNSGCMQNIYLIPETILINLGATKFREYLCEKFSLRINTFKNQVLFDTATVNNILLEVNDAKIKKIMIDNDTVDEKHFVAGRFSRISIFQDEITVSDLFEVSQGLIPYDKYRGHTQHQIKNRVYHDTEKRSSLYKPELKGKDVRPLAVSFSGNHFVKYGDWLAAPRHPKFFNGPRVLVREITRSQDGRITSAYCEDEYYFTPSVISIIPKKEFGLTKKNLMTLSVLLSSSLYAEYHYETNPKAKKGTFPKILVTDVRKLPLPKSFLKLDFSREYIKLTSKLISSTDSDEIFVEIDKIVLRKTVNLVINEERAA